MKRFIKLLSVAFLVLVSAFVLVGCKKTEKLEPETVKKANFGALKYYSMDLSDIPGYEDKKVTGGTWQETYDAIIGFAKKEADDTKRTALYHKAEDLLMSTGTIVPLYYYTDIYMKKENVEGFFGTPSGSKFFKYATVGGSTANINICLASEPDTIDPARNSSVDGATIILHTFAGLVGYNDKGELFADLATELPEAVPTADGGVTYTFTIKDGAKWSDGTKIDANDFVYAWNRAAGSDEFDYGYLFEIVSGYGSENGLDISASADGKQFTVKLPVDVPYFFELCAFPTFMPVNKSAVEANPDGWATDPATYICNGPYKMESWDHNSKIVLVKNPDYVNASTIKMEKISNFLSDDDTNILAGFKSGAYDFIDSVPNDEIPNLKQNNPKEFFVTGQLGTYYVIFNNNTDLLPSGKAKGLSDAEKLKANEEIRFALSLLIDRNYIVEEIGQAGQVPASSFVAMGITNADGSEFYKTAGGNSGYAGYYNTAADAYAANCAKAVEILKKYFQYDDATKKFTNFTKFDYLYNTSTGHQQIGEYLQSCYAAYGIEMSLANQEWATFLETRKQGNYTVARNGWLADYNDPINMLDMWVSYSGNNDAQLGK